MLQRGSLVIFDKYCGWRIAAHVFVVLGQAGMVKDEPRLSIQAITSRTTYQSGITLQRPMDALARDLAPIDAFGIRLRSLRENPGGTLTVKFEFDPRLRLEADSPWGRNRHGRLDVLDLQTLVTNDEIIAVLRSLDLQAAA